MILLNKQINMKHFAYIVVFLVGWMGNVVYSHFLGPRPERSGFFQTLQENFSGYSVVIENEKGIIQINYFDNTYYVDYNGTGCTETGSIEVIKEISVNGCVPGI